jgi:uncharacterized protein (DUF2141 family)
MNCRTILKTLNIMDFKKIVSKAIATSFIFPLALLTVLGASFTTADGTVTVEITNLKNSKGYVLMSLYNNAEYFPEDGEKAIAKGKAVITDGKATITFKNVPYGKYAGAFLHDENNNLKMDFNIVGIPKEGYGFTNNAKGTMGPPSFEKAAFEFNSPQKKITIKASYF